MSHLILAGYFGCGNNGDDAILLGYLNALELASPGHDFTVMAGSPDAMQRTHNLRAIDRRDGKAFSEALATADAVVFPGGSIFQDVTSQRSVFYYHDLVKKAKKAGKKVLLLGQGVGPVTGFFGKRLTAEAFKLADVISVRDPGSISLLQSLGVKRPTKVTADSALLLPQPPDTGEGGNYGIAGTSTIGIIGRPWGKGKATVELFANFCRFLFQNQMMPVLIEMDSVVDAPFIDEVEKLYGGRISHVRKIATPVLIQQRLARMDGLVSMRLHGSILGALAGLLPFTVSYDPKTTAFARLLGYDTPPLIQDLTAQRLFELFSEHQRLRDRSRPLIERNLADLKKAAEGNIELTIDALRLSVPTRA